MAQQSSTEVWTKYIDGAINELGLADTINQIISDTQVANTISVLQVIPLKTESAPAPSGTPGIQTFTVIEAAITVIFDLIVEL